MPLTEVDSLDLLTFFCFKYLIDDKLYSYFPRVYRKQIEEADKRRPGSGDLTRQIIWSWISSITEDDYGRDLPLMKEVETLKSKDQGILNYSRFIDFLDDINSKFSKQIAA
jgi:hypothetical protein